MNNPQLMRSRQSARNATHHLDFLGLGHARSGITQRLPRHVLHGNVGFSFYLSYFVYFADSGMLNPGLGPGFLNKAHDQVGVATANKLQRNDATKLLVLGLIHCAHAALPKQLDKLIARPVFDGKCRTP